MSGLIGLATLGTNAIPLATTSTGGGSPVPSPAAGGEGSGLPAVQAGIKGLEVGKSVLDSLLDRKRLANDRHRSSAEQEQASLRGEATYRYQRQMIQGAIEAYYKKQGWPIPEKAAPGAFTTRPLPGDAPLYPDYNVNPSEWDYTDRKKTEEEKAADVSPQEAVDDLSKAQGIKTLDEAGDVGNTQPVLPKAQMQQLPAQSIVPNAQPQTITPRINSQQYQAIPQHLDPELVKLMRPYDYY